MQIRRPGFSKVLRPIRSWNERVVYGHAAKVRSMAPDGTLVADVCCRRCGYNLRTLRLDARCPECATPVGASVRGDELLYSDPAWLAKLALGSELLLLGWVAAFASFLGGLFCLLAVYVLVAITVAGMLCGTWLLTQPDPGGTGEAWYGRSRKLARGLPFAAMTGPIFHGVRDMTTGSAVLPSGVAAALLSAVILLAIMAGIGSLLAMLAFVKSLAATRITDRELSRRAGSAFALILTAAAVLFVGSLVNAAFGVRSPVARVVVVLTTVVPLFSLVGSILYFVNVLWRLRDALNVQLQLARQLWQPRWREHGPGGNCVHGTARRGYIGLADQSAAGGQPPEPPDS